MTIQLSYAENIESAVNDGFTQQLREVTSRLEQGGNFVFGEGFKEVVLDNSLYEEYREALLDGMGASERDDVGKIMDNSRVELVEQSMSAGITPVTSLSLPFIRKLWPRVSITRAIPVIPVEKPKFTILFMKPWLQREAKGPKLQLPEALMPKSDSTGTEAEDVYNTALGVAGNRPAMLPVAAKTSLFTWRQVDHYNDVVDTVARTNWDADAVGPIDRFSYKDVTTKAAGVDQTRTVKLSSGSASFNIFDNVATWNGSTDAYMTEKQKGLAAKNWGAKDLRYHGLDLDVRVSGVYMRCFPRTEAGAGNPDDDMSMVVKIEHAARDTITSNAPVVDSEEDRGVAGSQGGVTQATEGYSPMKIGDDWTRTGNAAYRTRGATPLRDVALMDTRTNMIRVRVAGLNDFGNYAQTDADDSTQAKRSAVSQSTIIVEINRETGQCNIFTAVDKHPGPDAVTGAAPEILGVELEMYLNQQLNENVVNMGWDVTDREITIPTAQHMGVPFPEEYLTDMLRMFDINGVAKAVELISQTIAQAVDVEGLQFLAPGRFNHSKMLQRNNDPGWSNIPGNWTKVFDCRQSSVFTGSPMEWLSNLRGVVDNLANQIMHDMNFQQGYFVILGNSMDTGLLTAAQWTMTSEVGDDGEVAGVPVGYRVARVMGGAFPYMVISSQNERRRDIQVSDYWGDADTRQAQQGVTATAAGGVLSKTYSPRVTGILRLFFIPTTPDQVTYRMFPYSFMVSNDNSYRHPDAPNVPALIAHRRYVFDSFTKAMGVINILNNDGTYTQ